MTRKRARKILMSIGTSRNHANWGLTAKPCWKTNAGVVEDTLTITLYAKLLRKKMNEGGITKESAFRAGEMKASELWLREVNHCRTGAAQKTCNPSRICPPPTLRRWCRAVGRRGRRRKRKPRRSLTDAAQPAVNLWTVARRQTISFARCAGGKFGGINDGGLH